MYCNNCGKLIPDDANFCNHCGAKAASSQYRQSGTAAPRTTQAAPRTAQSAPRATQSSETPKVTAQNSVLASQAKEKKNGGLGGILLVIIVFLICYFAGKEMGGSFLSSDSTSSDRSTIVITPATSAPSINAFGYPSSTNGLSFDDLLPDDAERLVSSSTFGSLEYAAFIGEYNSSLMLLEYGYEGDAVKRLENTLIIPTHDWDYASIGNTLINAEALIEELHEKHISFTGTASVIGDYEYIYVEVCITNLHYADTLQVAIDEELLIAPDDTVPASMSRCEQELKNQGFARK